MATRLDLQGRIGAGVLDDAKINKHIVGRVERCVVVNLHAQGVHAQVIERQGRCADVASNIQVTLCGVQCQRA